MASEALKKLSIANSPKPTTAPTISTEGQRAKGLINEFRQNIDNGATPKEARSIVRQSGAGLNTKDQLTVAKTARDNTTITASDLQPQPSFKLTQPAPAVQGVVLSGIIQDETDTFTKNLEAKKKQAESTQGTALDNYLKSLQSRQGIEGFTTQIEDQTGFQDIESELNDINQQIREEQLAMRRAIERIMAQGGQSKGQAQSQINNLERESLAKQADLSIIQLGKQAKYDSAVARIDRKAKALFEQENNTIEALKFNYIENKDLFTKAEQRLFETKLADRERKLQADIDNRKSIDNLALQAQIDGAPTHIVQQMLAAKTKEEAIGLGGQYIGALDRESKRANIAQSYASIRASTASAQKSEYELKQISQINSGESNIAVQALDAFSGSLAENNRKQYTAAIIGAVKRGNVEQTEIALKNAAQSAAGKALTEDVIKRDQAIGALKDVKKALSEYEEAGGQTGLLVGGYEGVQNKLGKTTDPKLASIETRINLALNAYTNAVSGASFTPQESDRYKALFPSTSKQSELNTAKIDTLLSTFESNNQVFYGNFYGGYTPSQLAEKAVYEELIATATPEQLAELGIQ